MSRVFSFDALQTSEQKCIQEGRAKRLAGVEGAVPWSGIGLSGGGIRSACLALGVLQALASRNLLRRFDYISTVSGGGYIGSSLQWWWAAQKRDDTRGLTPAFGLDSVTFPYQPFDPAEPLSSEPPKTLESGLTKPVEHLTELATKNLEFLRNHASYLTPGNGLSVWSMLVVLLRTVAISLLIWIPLLSALFYALHAFVDPGLQILAEKLSLPSPVGKLMATRWDQSVCPDEPFCAYAMRATYAFSLYVFYGSAILFAALGAVYALLSRAPQEVDTDRKLRMTTLVSAVGLIAALIFAIRYYAQLDLSLIIILFVVIGTSVVILFRILAERLTEKSLNASYWLRRTLEKWLGVAFLPWLLYFGFGLIPVLPSYLNHVMASSGNAAGSGTAQAAGAGLLTLISGVASALYGYYTFIRSIVPGFAPRIAATAGSIIYIFGTLVLAYWLSLAVAIPGVAVDDLANIQSVACCLVIVAVALASIANVNYVGLHRFYRDRLMEAFMPKDSCVDSGRADYSPVADKLSMGDLGWDLNSSPQRSSSAPYPLINTNAIMIRDDDPTTRGRGGTNFLISPLFVGSSVTGWQNTKEFIDQTGPLTLATVMAASGAAASTNAGYIGTGLTMNPLISLVMSLLNVRLGVWIANPWTKPKACEKAPKITAVNKSDAKVNWIKTIPTFFVPGLMSALGGGHRSDSKFVELTDGGHFENLAIYELIRRKLPLILIVDGEADPSINLASLVSARNRIEQDFRAKITFEDGQGPELLVMHPEKGYPLGVKYAQSPYIVGKIEYVDGTVGTLIYIKSNITPKLDFSISGYLASNPDFPHQTTADQFFSPDQFEAYRKLGVETAMRVIEELKLETLIGIPTGIYDKYVESGPRMPMEKLEFVGDRPRPPQA
jgi:Patatin-like phospholipase